MNDGRRRIGWTEAELRESFEATARDAWQRPKQAGYFEGVKSYATIAAPFLAGFAFAAITILIGLDDPPPMTDAAILCFVLATLGFLYALQFGSWMQVYASRPSDRLDWHREAAIDRARFLEERARHAAELRVAETYLNRLGAFFDGGLLAFLLGIMFLVVPERWSVVRAATLAPVVLALLFETYGMAQRLSRGRVPGFWQPDVEAELARLDLPEPTSAAFAAMNLGAASTAGKDDDGDRFE